MSRETTATPWRVLLQVAAVALLVLIAADVSADAQCVEVIGGTAAAALSAPQAPESADPCDTSCVPDCFCCCVIISHALAPYGPPSVPLVELEVKLHLAPSPGVVRLLDLPPLAFS